LLHSQSALSTPIPTLFVNLPTEVT
jgi:hypothetical protein